MKLSSTLCSGVLLAALLSAGCATSPEAVEQRFRTLPTYSVVFSPVGDLLAGGLPVSGVLVVDARDQRVKYRLGERPFVLKRALVVPHDWGTPLAFSPDGRWLATLALDYDVATEFDQIMVHLWDINTGTRVRKVRGDRFQVRSMVFSPDSSRLAIAVGDSIVVVDPSSGDRIIHGRAHQGATIALAYTPDGSALASGGEDGVLRFWDSRDYKPIREIGGFVSAVTGVAFSSDGKRMAVAAGGHELRLFDAAATGVANEGQVLPQPSPAATQPQGAATVALFNLLSILGGARQARLVGAPVPVVLSGQARTGANSLLPRLCDAQAAFSPDGARLAHATRGSVSITNLTMDATVTRKNPDDLACAVAFSPDGKRVAAGGGTGMTIRMYDGLTGELIPLTGR